jgi:hypothetical protein
MALMKMDSVDFKRIVGDKDTIIETKSKKATVYHVPIKYDDVSLWKIRSPMVLFTIYRNVDEVSMEVSWTAYVTLYREWPKKSKQEKEHEAFWNSVWGALGVSCAGNAGLKAILGRPGLVADDIKTIVSDPEFTKGPKKGQLDPSRSPRLKPKLWTKRRKDDSGKALNEANEKGEVVPDMLCSFKSLDGEEEKLEDLIERPCLGCLSIMPSSVFFGAKDAKPSIQLKVTSIVICKKMKKIQRNDFGEDELNELRQEMSGLVMDETAAVKSLVGEDSGSEHDVTATEDDTPPPKKVSPPKNLVKKVPIKKEEEDDEEKPIKKEKTAVKKEKVPVKEEEEEKEPIEPKKAKKVSTKTPEKTKASKYAPS